MSEQQSNHVRIVKLTLRDYGVFQAGNELEFFPHRTVVTGASGTGKTTIAQALANLGPAPGVKPNIEAKQPSMSAEVETSGDRDLIRRYGHLIFLACEANTDLSREILTKEVDAFSDGPDGRSLKGIRANARELFKRLLAPHKIPANQNFNRQGMSAEEAACFNYAFAFACRELLCLDVPVVFDSPWLFFDLPTRRRVREFLQEQSCQQILIGNQHEFDTEDKPHHLLVYEGASSRVLKVACEGQS